MAIYAVEISIINKKYKHIPLEKNISRTVESQKKRRNISKQIRTTCCQVV